MFSSLCITASAIKPDIGDPMGVPLTCSYIWPLNWKYVVRHRFMHSIQLVCCIFDCCGSCSSLLSNCSMVSFASFCPIEVYNAVTSKDTIISCSSIWMSLIFSRNWIAELME
uniref:Uncharacterized protein n=1 Tax=Trichobilharzia regenti TaxID=157069 RepID=A0AA85J5J3_TRIRE|nr:unnamed protein product [Trichobilharzia regenti]